MLTQKNCTERFSPVVLHSSFVWFKGEREKGRDTKRERRRERGRRRESLREAERVCVKKGKRERGAGKENNVE